MAKGSGSLKAVSAVADRAVWPIATGVTAGVVANQLPQNRKSSKKAKEEIKDKLSKRQIFKSDNPDFNQEAANKAYNLVMKMDLDEARLFSQMVVGEMLEDDINRNLRTLQGHLNAVVAKRIDRIKKALLTSVSKGGDGMRYAEAIVELEKAWQNPYQTGAYTFQESDFRRDPHSGQFRVKVKHNPNERMLQDPQAANLGINTNDAQYRRMTPSQRSRYQQEYMQISNFLNAVAAGGTLGDHDVRALMEDSSGERYYRNIVNGPPGPTDQERVLEVEAKPKALTAGGAAFGLTNALGAPLSHGTMGVLNRADQSFGHFAGDWNTSYDPSNTNARLYSRISAGSRFVEGVAPFGSHAQIAARLARVVGDRGPEAEKAFGPAARRTAYRYRGTERAPDAEVMREYEHAYKVGENRDFAADQKAAQAEGGVVLTNEERNERDDRVKDAIASYRNQLYIEANRGTAERGETIRRTGRKITETGEEVPTSNIKSIRDVKVSTADRTRIRDAVNAQFLKEIRDQRAKNPEVTRAAADSREVLLNHLEERMPNRDLYNLQLDAGNTPPSEGFLIDAKGQVVAQAVGYGDDHYLPFNLKNLAALKGGEYIRTRSVGGPTTEDIYTGLMAGARSITVTSRSGIFTVDFQDDFRGGRRYNDKALRMTKRYAQILDSVQSEAIDRHQPVSPEVKASLTKKVRDTYPSLDRKRQRVLIDESIANYKKELEMTVGEEEEFDNYFAEVSEGMSEGGKRALQAAMKNDWRKQNEFIFRLNGEGYKDALHALREQFPYYLKEPRYTPRIDPDRIETEVDAGYVEPGANRPTKANAGWHGTTVNPGVKFQSASTVNYARPLYRDAEGAAPAAPAAGTPAGGNGNGAAAGTNGTNGRTPAENQAASEAEAREETRRFAEVALPIQEALSMVPWGETVTSNPKLRAMLTRDRSTAAANLADPEGARDFVAFMEQQGPTMVQRGNITRQQLRDFDRATGRLDRRPYTKELGLTPVNKPFLFPGEDAYKTDATQDQITHEIATIEGRTKSVRGVTPLGQMTDDQLKGELTTLTSIWGVKRDLREAHPSELIREMGRYGVDTNLPGVTRILDSDDLMQQQIEDVHRMRALNLNRAPITPSTPVTSVAAPPPALTPNTPAVVSAREELTGRATMLRTAANRLGEVGTDQAERLANYYAQKATMLEIYLANATISEDERRIALAESEDARNSAAMFLQTQNPPEPPDEHA